MSEGFIHFRLATTVAHAAMVAYFMHEHASFQSFRLSDAIEGVDFPYSVLALVSMSILCGAPIAILLAMGLERWWAFLLAAILDSGFVSWHLRAWIEPVAPGRAAHDVFFLAAFLVLMACALYSGGELTIRAFFRGRPIPRAQPSDGPKPRSRPR